jgi:GxxExxY protein
MTQSSSTEEIYQPLSDREKWLAEQIINIAITIHKTVGPGLLESVYEKCFCYELEKRGITYSRQQSVSLIYDSLVIDDGLRLDILVDDLVIVELKAQENKLFLWQAQLLSYMKLSKIRLGYILNFHIPLMKDGIKRMIL